jgi:Flp pilus assembly pilin Flp
MTMRRFLAHDRGATTVEYALIAIFVSISAIAALRAIGTEVAALLGMANAGFTGAP